MRSPALFLLRGSDPQVCGRRSGARAPMPLEDEDPSAEAQRNKEESCSETRGSVHTCGGLIKMGTNPEIRSAPATTVEPEKAATNIQRCGKPFQFWRCLACGINWRPDYQTELCDSCMTRIFPSER